MSSVSVALCTYNGSSFLGEQLASIVAQSRQPQEIVVSDDGSTDDTREVIEHFARDSPVPIRLLQPGPRLGVTANFARALGATTGDLVALSDQDDVWHPNHLGRLADTLDRDRRLLLVHSDARLVDVAGRPVGGTLLAALRMSEAERVAISDRRAIDVLIRRNVVTGATLLLRRELLELASPFPEAWVHDEWLALVAAVHDGVALVDEPLLDYRQHGGNVIGAQVLTPRRLLGRLVEPSVERTGRLALKWEVAARDAEMWVPSPEVARRIRDKATFERERAEDPRGRLGRLPRILSRLATGRYAKFASQGRLDALRDLLSKR